MNKRSKSEIETTESNDDDEAAKSDSDVEFLECTSSSSYSIGKQEDIAKRLVSKDRKFSATKLRTNVQQTSILNFVQKTVIKKGRENRTVKVIADKNKPVANIVGEEMGCPAYKRIQGTPYAVDAFSYGSLEGVSIYFLSHFHYDHYFGLSKRFDKLIYCSTITANLLKTCLKISPEYVVGLTLDKIHSLPDGSHVQLLDAFHCPGAVLFLFRLKNGRNILHTGDLRADKVNVVDLEIWKTIDIDLLYLDTTYCNPTYRFPSQNEIIRKMLSHVEEILTKNSKTLICVGSYSIGKEKVFQAISDKLNLKVYCNAQKLRLLRCLDDQQLESRLTNKPKETNLHVVPMNIMRFDRLKDYFDKFADQYSTVLAIKPTGWEFRNKGGNFGALNVSKSGCMTILGVPYSEHSSFDELKYFVQRLKPKQVIPTVFNKDQDLRRMLGQIESWILENSF